MQKTSPVSIVQRTADHVRQLFSGESSGHDWHHVDRVRKLALHIGREEQADLFIIELAALLHDIADWKFADGDETAGPIAAESWLQQFDINPEIVQHISTIIAELSFKGAQVATPMSTLEGKVVQDADRLDAIGAIGIARTFAYGGYKGSSMYEPTAAPRLHETFEEYKKNAGSTINHFFEKLLLLKDRMNTAAARRIAAGRHEFMEQFLQRFFAEWNGEEVI